MNSFARWKKFKEEARKTNIPRLRGSRGQGRRILHRERENSRTTVREGRGQRERTTTPAAGGSLGMTTKACLGTGTKGEGSWLLAGFPEWTAPLPVYLSSDKWGGRKFVLGCCPWELSLLVRLSGRGGC